MANLQSSPATQRMQQILRIAGLLFVASLAAACGSGMNTRPPSDTLLTDSPVRAGLALEAPLAGLSGPGLPARLFISGHSLVDQPFPDHLASLAERSATPLHWDRLYLVGSSIKQRSPPQLSQGPYDALLITEQHGLLSSLLWNDTERHLREWHEAVLEDSPRAVTYFYVPWLSLDSKDQPERWIAYERGAAHVWQCVATRVNASLQAEGRQDRIVTVPASLALAFLIEKIQSGASLTGISGGTGRESIDRIVADTVHLTPLGSFYMALVNYLALSGASPASLAPMLAAPVSAAVTPDQAQSLLSVAGDFLATRVVQRQRALEPPGCRQYLEESFIDDYWEYARLAQEPAPGWRSHWSAFKSRMQSRKFVRNW